MVRNGHQNADRARWTNRAYNMVWAGGLASPTRDQLIEDELMGEDYRALCAELLKVVEISDDFIMNEESTVELADRARVALAEPQPPADGEVGELVEWLRLNAEDYASDDCPESAAHFTRAADLLEQLAHDHVADASKMVEPTDEELYDMATEYDGEPVQSMQAALARWGRWPN